MYRKKILKESVSYEAFKKMIDSNNFNINGEQQVILESLFFSNYYLIREMYILLKNFKDDEKVKTFIGDEILKKYIGQTQLCHSLIDRLRDVAGPIFEVTERFNQLTRRTHLIAHDPENFDIKDFEKKIQDVIGSIPSVDNLDDYICDILAIKKVEK